MRGNKCLCIFATGEPLFITLSHRFLWLSTLSRTEGKKSRFFSSTPSTIIPKVRPRYAAAALSVFNACVSYREDLFPCLCRVYNDDFVFGAQFDDFASAPINVIRHSISKSRFIYVYSAPYISISRTESSSPHKPYIPHLSTVLFSNHFNFPHTRPVYL